MVAMCICSVVVNQPFLAFKGCFKVL
uniref:Uncharacterized protein n=1 Tax=Arundo donax TaxID=35708 RepID=A0A0A9F5R8_ARUDO